ncbi:MAG: glycosyltransferase [Alphaproteobacteria bacterium]
MTEARSVTLFLSNLVPGGAERVTLHLANQFATHRLHTTLLLQRKKGALLSDVPRHVLVEALDARNTFTALFPLIKYLRQNHPDILLANMVPNAIIAVLARLISRTQTKIVICLHNPPSAEGQYKKKWQFKFMLFLSYLLFRWADKIIAVSDHVAQDTAKIARLKRDEIITIYNPVISADFDVLAAAPLTHPWLQDDGPPVILAVGRLVAQKDYALLVQAFSAVAHKKNVRLIILGDGPLLEDLKQHALKLGVEDRMQCLGYQANPIPFMKKAALLVTPSQHEGFGNVIAEALACGTPVVSTNCGGPAEILDNGRYGPLVPVGNVYAMAQAIQTTLDNPLPREVLKQRGHEFTIERSATEYRKIFDQLLA